MSTTPSLPNIDVMISRLAERLKKSPGDGEGWRMLAWSYFHTKDYKKSVEAYDRALKLNPGSKKLHAALSEARSKFETSADASDRHPSSISGPTTTDIKNASKLSPSERQAMIKAMVEKLSARLKKSPRDADGWQHLIRSRIVLGERKAAQEALTSALEIFSDIPDLKARIALMARQLGMDKLN